MAFHRALESLWRATDHANKYVVVTSPFTLAKDPAQRPRVGAILHHLLEALFVIAVELRPFMPETSARLLELIGLPADARIDANWRWGAAVAAGHTTGKSAILFPRIEVEPAS
jgi:methionyl-tRNA synthetase